MLEPTVIHHNFLSKKDQSIKEKLFSHPKSFIKPTKKSVIPSEKTGIRDDFSLKKPSNQQIDDFLNNMQKEFKKSNESTFFFILKPFLVLFQIKRTSINRNTQSSDKSPITTKRNHQ